MWSGYSLGRLKAKPFAKFCTECRTVYENFSNYEKELMELIKKDFILEMIKF